MIDEPKFQIALVGGDSATQTMLCFLLGEDSCDTDVTEPHALFASVRSRSIDLLVVVLSGRREESNSLLEWLRRAAHLPLLVVLMRGTERTLRQRAFGLGARDVIGLPATPRELQARLRGALGQAHGGPDGRDGAGVVRAGGLTLGVAAREVRDGADWRVPLTGREAALLAALMRTPGQVVRRDTLLDQVWGEAYEGDGNALEVYVRRLRAKLTRPSAMHTPLATQRGRGYMFEARARPRSLDTWQAPMGAVRVLIVRAEDTPTCDEATTETAAIVRASGYAVACEMPSAALTAAARLRPDVILQQGGDSARDTQLRARLRGDARTARTPVILIVDTEKIDVHDDATDADDVLLAPVRADDLLLRVRRLGGSAVPVGEAVRA